MAKYKIQAGQTIEVATPAEVQKAIERGVKSWAAESVIGGRYVRFNSQKTVVNGAVSIHGNTGERLGPAPGFVWDVRRLRVNGLTGVDFASVYVNDNNPASLVASTNDAATVTGSGALFLWDRQVVLYPGDELEVSGTGLVTTGNINVNGEALELPIGQAWRLI